MTMPVHTRGLPAGGRLRAVSLASVLAMLCGAPPSARAGTVTVASVDSSGAQGGGTSVYPKLSGDGRFVVFITSSALVSGDTNSAADVYVRDRLTGATERVNEPPGGGNDDSAIGVYPWNHDHAAITPDGRFVVFTSPATNLVPIDLNANFVDAFLHDRQTGATEVVSLTSSGGQSVDHVFRIAVSADARFVAFTSNASDFVPGDTNRLQDVFVRDRCSSTGVPVPGCIPTTDRVSVGWDGRQQTLGAPLSWEGPVAMSADGRYVAFGSRSADLVAGGAPSGFGSGTFVRDRVAQTTELVSGSAGVAGNQDTDASMSADGRFAVFLSSVMLPPDPPGYVYNPIVYVRDRLTGMA